MQSKIFEYAHHREYYLGEYLHREDGPAIEYENGAKEYWVNGFPHREDGPAIDYNNKKEYCINGKLHREAGPAREFANGDLEYWLCGKQYSYEDWLRLRKLIVFL